MPAMQRVHIRVNDSATNQPTPCRIRFSDDNGVYYAPYGRLTDFAIGRNQAVGGNVSIGMKAYAYIDGACEIDLPPGKIIVSIEKGPEYIPQQFTFELKAGKLSQRFTIERWTNRRKQRWYSGDTRAHFIPPHAALLEAACEDVAVVNLLAIACESSGAYNKQHPAIPNLLAFSGQEPALQSPSHMVIVNTQNSHSQLGSLGLLNCHRIIFPLGFGGPDGKEDWSLADWCDQCHRKNGLVVWTKPWQDAEDFQYGEPLADLILGKVDAFEIDFFEDSPFDVLPDWYRLLNAGIRVPLVGGSGKSSNSQSLGCMRTYAKLKDGEEFCYANWIEAVRAGRVFATNGPLLSFTVNGHTCGEDINVNAEKKVTIEAKAESWRPFDVLELIANGEVAESVSAKGSPCSAQLRMDWQPQESQWLAVRCRGQEQILQSPANHRIFAHSAPIFIDGADNPFVPKPDAVSYWEKHLRDTLKWVETKARFDTEKQRRHLTGVFDDALKRFGATQCPQE